MEIRGTAAKILDKKPEKLSPFVNRDAFIAAASYLKKKYYSASCTKYANDYKNVMPKKILRERCAASQYYAGSN